MWVMMNVTDIAIIDIHIVLKFVTPILLPFIL